MKKSSASDEDTKMINKLRKEGFPIKDRKKVKRKISEESEKEKVGGKQNNSRSIKEREDRRSSDQINFRQGK